MIWRFDVFKQEAQKLVKELKEKNPSEEIQVFESRILKELEEDTKLPKGENFESDDLERQRIEVLLNWLQDSDSDFSKLKIRFYEKNYRGVHAKSKIHKGETILFVPLEKLITLEMAKDTFIGRKISENGLDLLSPKHSFLAIFLLLERKKEDSKWKPYLDILPSDYSTMPIFFSNEELEYLKGSPCLSFAHKTGQIMEKKADIKRDYDAIAGVAQEDFTQFSFHEFCWARMSASSRIFGITVEGNKTDAFVPLADMLNHRRPKQTSWIYDNDAKGFVIEALEDIAKGEQVYDSYGRKCNSRFFMNYGFIVEKNDADEVAITLSFDKDDPLLELKKELISGDIGESKVLRVMADLEEQCVFDFFSYIRFIVLRDKGKLLLLQEQTERDDEDTLFTQFKPKKTPVISLENELAMMERVKKICLKQLNDYPTSYEDDAKRLKEQIHINERNCILLRMGEKHILRFLIGFANKIIPLFKLKLKDIRKIIFSPELIEFADYIKKCVMVLMQREESAK